MEWQQNMFGQVLLVRFLLSDTVLVFSSALVKEISSSFLQEPSFSNLTSASQEGPEEVPGLGLNGKFHVTLLSSEWRSLKGGLSTISRELAIQLAKRPDLKVSLYLPKCSEDDKKAASSYNVQLIEAEEFTGFEPIDWLTKEPANHVMDFVIGHGVHLGRYAQMFQRRNLCQWIQVVHAAPEEIGKYKTYPDAIPIGAKKHQAEVSLCEIADQVVTVGPKLKEAFSRYLCHSQKAEMVINLTPSVFSEFSHVKQSTEGRETFHVLMLGRGDSEDFQLKGYDIVGKAIAHLRLPFRLMFVGAHSGKEDEVEKQFLDLGINQNQLTVRCFYENREQLAKLFCEVDLATMPSRTEGFGLVALEALSASLPVLVSANSGLGEALRKVPYGSQWIVDSEDHQDWANAIRNVQRKDRKLRLEEIKIVAEKYAEMFSWDRQCEVLVERMRNIHPGTFYCVMYAYVPDGEVI